MKFKTQARSVRLFAQCPFPNPIKEISKVFHLHQRDHHHHLQVVDLHNTIQIQLAENIQNLEKVQKEEVVVPCNTIQIQIQVVQNIHNLEEIRMEVEVEVDNNNQIVIQVRVVVLQNVVVLQFLDYNSFVVDLS
jgi:hypothetical protein